MKFPSSKSTESSVTIHTWFVAYIPSIEGPQRAFVVWVLATDTSDQELKLRNI